MSKKSELEKKIRDSEAELDMLEQKRLRSLSGFIEALVTHETPNPEDVEYFRTFSALIDIERENLRELRDALEILNTK